MRIIQRDIVSALIFSKDGKLLQGLKDPAKGGVYADCWHLPGGGVERGDADKLAALRREVKEETGIDLATYAIELVDDLGRGTAKRTLEDSRETVLCEMDFYVYKTVINDKNAAGITIKLNDDLVEYRWTDPAELKDMKLTPPSVELFQRLGYR